MVVQPQRGVSISMGQRPMKESAHPIKAPTERKHGDLDAEARNSISLFIIQ